MNSLTTNESVVTQITQDPYAIGYDDPNPVLPRIQAMRGEKGEFECGYFVTEREMEKAGWKAARGKDMIDYTFNSGKTKKGLLIKNPRMVVCSRSPAFIFDRQLTMQEKRLCIAGALSDNYDREKGKYGVGQYYEVLLLDKNNEPLSETTLGYCAKGANQATFSGHWKQLVEEVTRCHAISNGIPLRPKNLIFRSLCVFDFAVKRELSGDALKSFSCKVGSHLAPTPENWEQFFLGRSEGAGAKYLNLLAPSEPTMLCLSGGQSLEAIDV